MKHILLILVLTLSSGLFAQGKEHPFLLMGWGAETSGDSTFTIYATEENAEAWSNKLGQILGGTPELSEGQWIFRGLEIQGLGQQLTLKISDGYFRVGEKNARMGFYYKPADAKRHEKQKAKAESRGEIMVRITHARLLDSSGNEMLRSRKQVQLFLDWLNNPW